MAKNTRRRVGRRRWAELTRFLTATMKTSGSERVRMAAAERLTEILMLREQREIAELRASARATGANAPAPADEPQEQPTPKPTLEQAQQEAEAFLARMRGKVSDGQ